MKPLALLGLVLLSSCGPSVAPKAFKASCEVQSYQDDFWATCIRQNMKPSRSKICRLRQWLKTYVKVFFVSETRKKLRP